MLLLEAGSWKLEASCVSSLHTACVCPPSLACASCGGHVVGKNYRLQDIQLEKSERSVRPLAVAATFNSTIRARPCASRTGETFSNSVVAGPPSPPAAASARRPRWLANRSSFIGTDSPPSPRLRRATFAYIHERRLENTGLEPVTSWLQTRRSPS